MTRKSSRPKLGLLSASVLAALLAQSAVSAQTTQATETPETQTASESEEDSSDTKRLDRVVVTGSLIPQSEVETFTPITVISAEDIKVRGFATISEALKQSTLATGDVVGSQDSGTFTQGAETLSLFGLSVSYVKYLIDGRPMVDYPALYNGDDAFNNISGIPIDLVDRIEILPGGQSSLYGSDAIAGVINIILKKNIDHPVLSVRGGMYTEGAGSSNRISAAFGFAGAEDRFNVLMGAQHETSDPIWGYDRDITRQRFQNGTSAPRASLDWVMLSFFSGVPFLDPNDCANVQAGFGGTEIFQPFAGGGYCGSLFAGGYRTLKNSNESSQFYSHATFDLNENNQLYADVLYNKEDVSWHNGADFIWWGLNEDFGYYYDPNLDDFMYLFRGFAPEEMGPGGFENTMNINRSKSYAVTVGDRGMLGQSDWDFDVSLSKTEYKLDEDSSVIFQEPALDFFLDSFLGPVLGLDPYYGAYPVFEPDYAAFYTLMSPSDFQSLSGRSVNHSKTSDTLARIQVTNTALFSLPGGDAGAAFAVEGARQTWEYRPDQRLLDGEVWGLTSANGGGERDRYAVTGELRMPVFNKFTVSASSRYDSYTPDGYDSVSKATYSLGLEFRPMESLLLRGKIGDAFKAPGINDVFQEVSGYFSSVPDYYQCAQAGFEPSEIADCPLNMSSRQFFGESSGNPNLEPLTADVWSAGLVWAPLSNFSISADYYSWDIKNEVVSQTASSLTLREYYCRTGTNGFELSSPTCVDVLSKIERNAQGNIVYIFTPKVNEAQERLDAFSAAINYSHEIGGFGSLAYRAAYTNIVEHESLAFVGDDPIDLLRHPGYSSAPKTKVDASITWARDDWSATLYANRIGKTPNARASARDSYDDNDLARHLAPHTTYNLSVSFQATSELGLSLMVNNLLNEMPPEDRTYSGNSLAPYNQSQFNPFGRAMYLEMRYEFGKQ